MATLRFEDRDYEIETGETVLDALLRGGADVPWSCRRGICQSCVARRVDGAEVPADAQGDLKETLRVQNFFLACRWSPGSNVTISRVASSAVFSPATVADTEKLGATVCRLLLEPATPLAHRAGQFINLRSPDGLVRSYSIASLSARETHIELHVRKLQAGRVSGWVHDALHAGDRVEVEGPHGHCFYLPGDPARPLLLLGTGTGAAPLLGIARDALASGHVGEIHLYHGGRNAADLYLHAQLIGMAAENPGFHYHPAVTAEEPPTAVRSGRVTALAFTDHPRLQGWRVYVCGNPDMVKAARKRAYLAGAALADIHADPFEIADLRLASR